MNRHAACAVAASLLVPVLSRAAAPPAAKLWRDLDPARIEAVAALLSDGPRGGGAPIADRAAWGAIATNPAFARVPRDAEKLLNKPLPAWNDDLYLDYSRTGARKPGERMMSARRGRLNPLVWAEGVENRGRFLPEIVRILREYLAEPTWTLAAHDRSLGSFRGTAYEIDLVSSATAYELAQALWMLGDRLDPAVRADVIACIVKRVLAPFRETLRSGRGNGWIRTTSNWNPVCLAGTVGAALACLPDRADRALFAAAGEFYSRNYLAGFTRDGYCTEGIGYWNYGMGNYCALREHLWQATDGRLDLFADERVRNAALFGLRIEIADGQFPAIADCRTGSTPSVQILRYCSLALGLGLGRTEAAWDPVAPRNLTVAPMEVFPNSLRHARPAAVPADTLGLRSWFDDAGLLICRPATGDAARLASALKGGHNAEHHNHNDVGSYTLVLNGRMVAGDPGGPSVYTAKTFSKERYTGLKLFGSLGHPVPRVAGKFQDAGRQAAAKVLSTSFTDAADKLALDIASAYTVPGLSKLARAFVHTRGATPSLEIRDEFAAAAPVEFETVLTTRAKWRQASPATIEFDAGGGTRMVATIQTPDGGFDLASETIEEDCQAFDRIAIRLKHPLASGTVTVTFRPAKAE